MKITTHLGGESKFRKEDETMFPWALNQHQRIKLDERDVKPFIVKVNAILPLVIRFKILPLSQTIFERPFLFHTHLEILLREPEAFMSKDQIKSDDCRELLNLISEAKFILVEKQIPSQFMIIENGQAKFSFENFRGSQYNPHF